MGKLYRETAVVIVDAINSNFRYVGVGVETTSEQF